jgi:hypothetical protein
MKSKFFLVKFTHSSVYLIQSRPPNFCIMALGMLFCCKTVSHLQSVQSVSKTSETHTNDSQIKPTKWHNAQ